VKVHVLLNHLTIDRFGIFPW